MINIIFFAVNFPLEIKTISCRRFFKTPRQVPFVKDGICCAFAIPQKTDAITINTILS